MRLARHGIEQVLSRDDGDPKQVRAVHSGQRAVVVPATPAQAMTVTVHCERGHDHHVDVVRQVITPMI